MKKFYSLIAAIALTVGLTNAQPCTINPNAQTTPGVTPAKENLPCIQPGVAYNQTLQVKVQDSKDTTIIVSVTIRVDSVRIDSVVGLPNGISFSRYPDVILGGANGCGTISGTTNDAPGQYDLVAWGTAWLRAIVTSPIAIDTPYVYDGQLNAFSPFGDYYVTVCGGNSINTLNAELNKALSVYPNPSNGTFEVRLNGGSRVNGDMKIVDVTGRVVYTQLVDAVGYYSTKVDLTTLPKGIYTVQLRTAEGFASKNISID